MAERTVPSSDVDASRVPSGRGGLWGHDRWLGGQWGRDRWGG